MVNLDSFYKLFSESHFIIFFDLPSSPESIADIAVQREREREIYYNYNIIIIIRTIVIIVHRV